MDRCSANLFADDSRQTFFYCIQVASAVMFFLVGLRNTLLLAEEPADIDITKMLAIVATYLERSCRMQWSGIHSMP